ncbi:MAG TPA: DUF6031 family protein [Pseudonocardiaceae bacterium]|nr:DUF6031 family protein [Pseudonocardiaceae bacterium]
MSTADRVPVYPGLRAGHGRASADAVTCWLVVGWLMLAEGRAYVEDLQGGTEQPRMRQAAKLRLLELLVDIDNRLAGRAPLADAHCLAVGLEYGTHELIAASGTELAEIFGLDGEFGGDTCAVDEILTLWERLVDEYPGELPDRLVAQGHRDLLLALRAWAALARSVGLDVGLLTPFLKDA